MWSVLRTAAFCLRLPIVPGGQGSSRAAAPPLACRVYGRRRKAEIRKEIRKMIKDRNISKPRLMNSSSAFVWEVTIYKWDDRADDYFEHIDAVFYDPWKAVQYGIQNHGAGFTVQLSSRKI